MPKLIPFPRDTRLDIKHPDDRPIDYDLLVQEVEIEVTEIAPGEYEAFAADWPAILWADKTPEEAAAGLREALAAHLADIDLDDVG